MMKCQRYLIGILIVMAWAVNVVNPRDAFGEGELAVMFEDAVEFNNRTSLGLNLVKFHPIEAPADALIFFNLFCEGKAGAIGGTEVVHEEFDKTVNENGGGETFFNMTICEFCECAGLEGQAFDECHDANESCITVNNARFVFDPIVDPNLQPDPDFPEAVRLLFTMTEHDPATECTGKFLPFCDQGTLKLIHHCIHLFDAMGNIVKSVSSAYILSAKP